MMDMVFGAMLVRLARGERLSQDKARKLLTPHGKGWGRMSMLIRPRRDRPSMGVHLPVLPFGRAHPLARCSINAKRTRWGDEHKAALAVLAWTAWTAGCALHPLTGVVAAPDLPVPQVIDKELGGATWWAVLPDEALQQMVADTLTNSGPAPLRRSSTGRGDGEGLQRCSVPSLVLPPLCRAALHTVRAARCRGRSRSGHGSRKRHQTQLNLAYEADLFRGAAALGRRSVTHGCGARSAGERP